MPRRRMGSEDMAPPLLTSDLDEREWLGSPFDAQPPRGNLHSQTTQEVRWSPEPACKAKQPYCHL
jgi:hypothetical protein